MKIREKVRKSAKYTSERVKKISEKALACQGARFNSFHHVYGEDLYEASKNTAMISFDLFALEGFPVSFRNYKGAAARDLINRDACGFVAAAIMEIEERNKNPEATKIENIIIDLTANGGGAMPVMPYLAGIMTKDPVSRVKDQTSGRIVEYHYECDFDGDGTFGDTYADKYNFAILVSSGSFSCATALPGMLKGTNVKILGEKSAGGASPVTHFTDGCGINYQTSGSNIMVYKEGEGKYTSIEEGTPVDYEIPEKDWYNLDVLDAKMKEIFAKA